MTLERWLEHKEKAAAEEHGAAAAAAKSRPAPAAGAKHKPGFWARLMEKAHKPL